MRAADDETFRQALLADPDVALSSTDYTLDDYEHAIVDEYRRVASRMSEQQELDEHRGYMAVEQDSAAATI